MIGIRVMVRSLFRISGYLVLQSKYWRAGVLDGLDGMFEMVGCVFTVMKTKFQHTW